MDFVGENDEAFQWAPPLYHSLLKSVPGEYPVGVSQDEAVGRQVTAYCQAIRPDRRSADREM